MFAKLSTDIGVDITAKLRRNQLSLHPSPDVTLCSIHIRGGVVGSGDQSRRLRTLAYILVCCVEARAKLDTHYAAFTRVWTAVFLALPSRPSALSILIEMENLCSKSLLGTPLLSSLFY